MSFVLIHYCICNDSAKKVQTYHEYLKKHDKIKIIIFAVEKLKNRARETARLPDKSTT